MKKAIEIIEKRMSELERQRDNDTADTDHQRLVNSNYYRGALNELFRLKEKLKLNNKSQQDQ